MDIAMLDLFLTAFVTLFVVIDALGVAPIFATMTAGQPAAHNRSMALKGTIYASLLLLSFAFGGEWLLSRMGVSLDAFRIAGGLMLLMMSLEMLFEKRQARRENRAEAMLEDEEGPEDISVFPLAIPLLGGPGSIAAMMIFMSQAHDWTSKGVIVGAMFANMIIALVLLLLAPWLLHKMGHTMGALITRVFGVILAALSMQLIIDGIKHVFFAV
jgi:multiple antibiotic resistance protein